MRNRDRVGGACHLAALTGLAVAVVACDAGGTADRIASGAPPVTATCSAGRHDTLVLRSLLEATRDRVSAEERKRLIEQAGELPRDAASWLIHVFLQAELHRLTGDGPSAQAAYRDLVEWAAADPCGDGWGGSGLVALALWRWLEGAPDGVDVAEARRILDAAAELRSARLVRGMLDTGLVESLPRLEEEVLRWLARLAWRIGDRHRARQIFLHYLGVAGVSEFDAVDAVIAEDVLAAGLASRDWLTLARTSRPVSFEPIPAQGALLAWPQLRIRETLRSHLMTADKSLYEFGPFRLDPVERLLTRDGGIVPIPGKVFDTLVLFVRHSGRPLEKQTLMESIWPDTFVEEANLAYVVSILRKALGERPNGPKFIKTVPKHGYRFVAAVREIQAANGDPVHQPATPPAVRAGGDQFPLRPSSGRNTAVACGKWRATIALLNSISVRERSRDRASG